MPAVGAGFLALRQPQFRLGLHHREFLAPPALGLLRREPARRPAPARPGLAGVGVAELCYGLGAGVAAWLAPACLPLRRRWLVRRCEQVAGRDAQLGRLPLYLSAQRRL